MALSPHKRAVCLPLLICENSSRFTRLLIRLINTTKDGKRQMILSKIIWYLGHKNENCTFLVGNKPTKYNVVKLKLGLERYSKIKQYNIGNQGK